MSSSRIAPPPGAPPTPDSLDDIWPATAPTMPVATQAADPQPAQRNDADPGNSACDIVAAAFPSPARRWILLALFALAQFMDIYASSGVVCVLLFTRACGLTPAPLINADGTRFRFAARRIGIEAVASFSLCSSAEGGLQLNESLPADRARPWHDARRGDLDRQWVRPAALPCMRSYSSRQATSDHQLR
jgi:hypothetical protein